jgi:ribosomal protein S18 acetylase RimI-like enzyme
MLKNEATRNLEELEIGALDASEVGEALGVVTRGMRDNPTHVAAFGGDPEVRARRVRRLLGGALVVLDLQKHMLAARSADGAIVGVVGMLPPGECRPTIAQQLRLLPRLLSTGPRAAGRAASWMGTWAKHDPKDRHWHLGPLAVDAHLQGMGIGSKLMRVFCAKMDAAREDTYLETDKLINVRFYERFGFEVVSEQDVIGVTNWFMLRRAQGKKVGQATT